jgi:hypothetical protein
MKEKIIELISINGVINNRRITESYFKNNYYKLYLNICEKYNNIKYHLMKYYI